MNNERPTRGVDGPGGGPPGFDITRADTWPEFLTVEELAAILRSSTKAVREMIGRGDIEAMRGAGRGYRISKRWVITHLLHDDPP